MSEKWRQTQNLVEFAWPNEQKADFKWLWRHKVETKLHDETKTTWPEEFRKQLEAPEHQQNRNNGPNHYVLS